MNEWISVEDRLPPPGENVLLLLNNGFPVEMGVAHLLYDKKRKPAHYCICDFVEHEQRILLEYVTHWMPLPEGPKDE